LGNKRDYKAGETFSLRNNNGSVAVGSAAELIFISAFFLSALHRLFWEINVITRRARRFLLEMTMVLLQLGLRQNFCCFCD